MKKNSIKMNYIYNVAYELLVIVAPLITTPYISRKLGATGVGMYSFDLSIVTYFTLFAGLGTVSYGRREISFVQDDREKRTEIFWNTECLSCISTLLCLCIYGLFILLLANDRFIFLIFSMNIITVACDITWLFQGMEDFKSIILRNAIFKICNILYVFIFVHTRNDLDVYVFGMCLFPLLSVLSLWPLINRIVDRPDWKRIKPFIELKTVLSMYIPTIAISIYTVMDKTMLGVLTNEKVENGYYEQALKLSKTALTLVTALGAVMIPRVGYHFEKGDLNKIKSYIYRSYRFVWFLGIPLCMGLIGIASNIVPWFYGEEFGQVTILLRLLPFLILAIGINNVTGVQYLIPTKRQNIFTFTVIIGAVVNFILNLFLIPFLGATGAAVASVFAESVIAIVQIIIVRKELSPIKIISCSKRYLVAGSVMLFCLFGAEKVLDPSVFSTIIMVIGGGIVYFCVLIVLKDDFLITQLKS